MSALARARLPLAAFLAAALAGIGLGLALQSGDEPRRTARAGVGAAVTTELPTQQIPATPPLRLGTSPTLRAPAVVAPVRPQVPTTGTQAPPASRPQSGSGSSGLSVTDEPVVSP